MGEGGDEIPMSEIMELGLVYKDREAEETGVPLSNLMSYIAVNYVREEKKRRSTE